MKTSPSPLWVNLTIFTLTLFAGVGWAQEAATEAKEEAKSTAIEGANATQLEIVRRQESLISAQLMIKEAESLATQGDYVKALSIYKEAEKKLTNAPASSVEFTQIRQGASVCAYSLARSAYERGEYDAAAGFAQQSLGYNDQNLPAKELFEAATRSAAENRGQMGTEDGKKAPEALPKELSDSEFVAKQRLILERYRSAENYMKSEQFDEAERTLKDILRYDPYSATAYYRLREVQAAKYRKLDSAKRQTEMESMVDVSKGWVLPLRRDKLSTKVTGEDPSGGDGLGTLGGKTPIMQKLNSIIIKKIEFENTPIMSAINYLINEAREADPDHKGVNIIPAFATGGGFAPAETPPPADGTTPEGGVPAPTPAGGGQTVTLNLRDVPLINAIKFLTSVTGLKYRVEPDAVMIVTNDATVRRVQTRTFNISPGVFRPLMDEGAGGGGGGRGGGGGGGAGGGFVAMTPRTGGATTRRVDVRKVFQDFGMEFPQGTSVSYNESLSILVATHTNDVLDQMEEIIIRLNKTLPQVQIEAKFIDVRQSDLEQLGFRWAFAPTTQHQYTVESGSGTALPGIPIGGPYRGLGNPLTNGLRSTLSASALDALLAGATGGTANTVMTITGVLTNPQVQLFIDALSQKGLTNLLSAPRVTTTSGESAKILVTREFIYPSAFTDPVVSTGTSSSTGGTGAVAIAGPSPSAFSTREIGVILDVKPSVSSDTYTINMTLSPEVVDFEGFVNYTTSAVAGDTVATFTLPQPVFNKRTLTTSVIIWDGQTIMLGGLIRESQSKVDDKVPFLGDIPMIGRLFRSKIDSTTKQNLLIFLNARIVDPGGKPVRDFSPKALDVEAPPVKAE